MTDVESLAQRVAALSPADRLRAAVFLIEMGKTDLAEAIAEHAMQEIALARLLANIKDKQ